MLRVMGCEALLLRSLLHVPQFLPYTCVTWLINKVPFKVTRNKSTLDPFSREVPLMVADTEAVDTPRNS